MPSTVQVCVLLLIYFYLFLWVGLAHTPRYLVAHDFSINISLIENQPHFRAMEWTKTLDRKCCTEIAKIRAHKIALFFWSKNSRSKNAVFRFRSAFSISHKIGPENNSKFWKSETGRIPDLGLSKVWIPAKTYSILRATHWGACLGHNMFVFTGTLLEV